MLLALVLLASVTLSQAASWGYGPDDGPGTAAWGGDCPTGTSQSPIDIPYEITYVDDWLPFQFQNYKKEPRINEVYNNGHSVVVTHDPEGCEDNRPRVSMGNLPGTYEFAQYHFHWGWYHDRGSEHTIHGKQYDAELHLVHYNIECGRDLGSAIAGCNGAPDTLAVLGIMIEEGDFNPHLESLMDSLHHVETYDAKTHFKPTALADLLPSDTTEFWRYMGSLTTPDCNELVVWTVFKNPIQMSKSQMKKFFGLKTETGIDIEDNFRPPQPLNGREVFFANLELKCNHHHENNWHHDEACNIGHRETKEEYDFNDAVHACIGWHYDHSIRQGLIPVGKLRCMRNRYGQAMSSNEDDFCHRYFRVNGIKSEDGYWREYPSGRRVSFTHFPEFHELHGGVGDTLVWDALENRLYIDSKQDKYSALCYRQYERECEQCAGFETGFECSEAGDCMNHQCVCDMGFHGQECQHEPIPPMDLVMVGNDASGSTTEVMDTASLQSCEIASYEIFSGGAYEYMMCDYVFGKGICCGGSFYDTTATSDVHVDMCGVYDCFVDNWVQFHDLPKKAIHSGHAVVRQDQRDQGWLISGGKLTDGSVLNEMWWLDEDLRWSHMDTVMPTARKGHCSVQINSCEVALIGGSDMTTNLDTIDIYNFKTNTWRAGPTLNYTSSITKCGKVYDKKSWSPMIVIGASGTVKPVEIYDVQKERIYLSEHVYPGTDYELNYLELTDTMLIVPNGATTTVYTFTLDDGFQPFADSNDVHEYGSAFLAPRLTTTCVA